MNRIDVQSFILLSQSAHYTFTIQLFYVLRFRYAGADPGEGLWVHFYP